MQQNRQLCVELETYVVVVVTDLTSLVGVQQSCWLVLEEVLCCFLDRVEFFALALVLNDCDICTYVIDCEVLQVFIQLILVVLIVAAVGTTMKCSKTREQILIGLPWLCRQQLQFPEPLDILSIILFKVKDFAVKFLVLFKISIVRFRGKHFAK